MPSFNKVILVGNLTADPELKQTPSGVSVCRFTIAVQRRYSSRNAEGGQPTADFFNIVAWRQNAEFVSRFFKKGRPILVCGQLQNNNWTDQQGQKRYSTEIQADECQFVDSRQDGGAPASQSNSQNYTPDAYSGSSTPAFNSGNGVNFEEIPSDDGLPF